MSEISFFITLFLFIVTSILSVLSWKLGNDRYIKIIRYSFALAVICFIALGIFRLILSYNSSFFEIATSIWGYFYILSLCIIMITLYIFFKGRRSQFNSYITIISSFISLVMILSLPFFDSSRKFTLSNDLNSFQSHILPLHIIISICGEILFFFSFAGSILYLIMEWQLRKKSSMRLIFQLPNLESINNFNKWSISRSLIFISLGILTGMIMAFAAYDKLSLGTAKEVHLYFSWVIIFCVFFIRRNLGIAPHKASIINILLFVLIMFLFIFTNVFIQKGFHSFI